MARWIKPTYEVKNIDFQLQGLDKLALDSSYPGAKIQMFIAKSNYQAKKVRKLNNLYIFEKPLTQRN